MENCNSFRPSDDLTGILTRLLLETLQDVYSGVSLLTNGPYKAMFDREMSHDFATIKEHIRQGDYTFLTKTLPTLGAWVDNLLKGEFHRVPDLLEKQTIGLPDIVVRTPYGESADDPALRFVPFGESFADDLYIESLAGAASRAARKHSMLVDPRWYTSPSVYPGYDLGRDLQTQVQQYVVVPKLLRCVWPILMADVQRPWNGGTDSAYYAVWCQHVESLKQTGVVLPPRKGREDYDESINYLIRAVRTFAYLCYKLKLPWDALSEAKKLQSFVDIEKTLRSSDHIDKLSKAEDLLWHAKVYCRAALMRVSFDPFGEKIALIRLERQRRFKASLAAGYVTRMLSTPRSSIALSAVHLPTTGTVESRSVLCKRTELPEWLLRLRLTSTLYSKT